MQECTLSLAKPAATQPRHLLLLQMDTCRRSCKECETCTANDYTCINKNRKRGGYLEIDPDEMKMLGVDLFQGLEPSPEL